MKRLLILLLFPALVHAEQNCWIAVPATMDTEVKAEIVKQKAEAALEAAPVEAVKGEVLAKGEIAVKGEVKPEPIALSASKLEAVDVLKRVPDREVVDTLWRKPTISSVSYQNYSVYLDNLDELDKITAGYGAEAIVLGCWDWDTGKITHELDPRIMDVMPDDVEYDEAGNEISRKRPTKPKQTNLIYGQAERQWE